MSKGVWDIQVGIAVITQDLKEVYDNLAVSQLENFRVTQTTVDTSESATDWSFKL